MARVAKALVLMLATFKHLTRETKLATIAEEEIANGRDAVWLVACFVLNVTLKIENKSENKQKSKDYCLHLGHLRVVPLQLARTIWRKMSFSS